MWLPLLRRGGRRGGLGRSKSIIWNLGPTGPEHTGSESSQKRISRTRQFGSQSYVISVVRSCLFSLVLAAWRPGGAQEGAWWTGWASGRSPANDRGPLDGSTFVEPNPLAPDKTTKLESIDDLQAVLWTSPAWALVPEFFLRSAGLTGLAGGGGAGHTKRRCSPKPQVWVPLDLPW